MRTYEEGAVRLALRTCGINTLRSIILALCVVFGLPASGALGQQPKRQNPTDLIAPLPGAESLSRYIPSKDLLVYVEHAGLNRHVEGWHKTNAYKMLNDTTLGEMLESVVSDLVDQTAGPMAGIQGSEVKGLIEFALKSGFVVAINDDPSKEHQNPELMTIVLRDGNGPKAPPVLAKLMAMALGRAEDVQTPGGRKVKTLKTPAGTIMASWSEKTDLVFVNAANEEQLNLVYAAIDGKAPSSDESALLKGTGDPTRSFEPVVAALIDLEHIGPLPDQAVAMGLKGVKTIKLQRGFDADALMTVITIDAPKPRTGLLQMFDQPTFLVRDLPPLPKEATGFSVMSLEWGKFFDETIALAKKLHPESVQQIDQVVAGVNQATGLDLKQDLLSKMGPKTVFVGLPSRHTNTIDPWSMMAVLWLQTPKAGMLIEMKDPEGLAATIDKLAAFGNKALDRPAAGPGKKPLKAEFRKVAGARGYTLVVPPGVFPLPQGLKPTILIGKKSMVIATQPESAKRLLEPETNSAIRWAPTGDLAKTFDRVPGKLTYLSFDDPREGVFPELLSNIPALVQGIAMLQANSRPPMAPMAVPVPPAGAPPQPPGFPGGPGGPPGMGGPKIHLSIDPDRIPDPESLRKLMFPSFTVAQVDGDAFRIVTREAVPSINPSSMGLSSAPVMVALLLPAVQAAREAARRAQCTNNEKQIALAMFNFESANGKFPGSAITDKAGKPLLSWRVAILPYLDQQNLYNQFKLDEPWDSPNNIKLLPMMPPTLTCPSDSIQPGKTKYRVFSGKGAAFEGTQGHGIAEFTDGTSNTIMLVEANEFVEWTKPEGLPFENNPQFRAIDLAGSKHPGGFNVSMCDGSVRFIKRSINPATFNALITRNAGEVINFNDF